jgi:hypothetical protein
VFSLNSHHRARAMVHRFGGCLDDVHLRRRIDGFT